MTALPAAHRYNQALDAPDPAEATERLTRANLRERLDALAAEGVPAPRLAMLRSLVDALPLTLPMKSVAAVRTLPSASTFPIPPAVTLGLALAAMVAVIIFPHEAVRIPAAAIALVGGFLSGMAIAVAGRRKVHTEKLVPALDADALAKRERSIAEMLTAVAREALPPTPQMALLKWMQREYADTDNEYLRRSMARALALAGFRLENYTPALADHFQPISANVPTLHTATPALFDDASRCVLPGEVVFPINI